jgi:AhpC/TSA family
LAKLHPQFLGAGTRLFAISIDSPRQNSAMVEKLSLPFPYLSDPDRSQAIGPFGVADEKDERNISRPAMVMVTPEGKEVFRFESRDFADRMPETDVLANVQAFGFPATTQEPPEVGPAEAGPRTLSVRELRVYFRGARFAAQAMGLRHAHFAEEIKIDSKAYVAEMDRYTAAIEWLESLNSE